MVKTLNTYISDIQWNSQIKKWFKPALQVLSTQIIIQFVGLGISVVLIRQMPKEDYAIYTILVSIQSMLIILSDSGISVAFKSIGGKVWQDNLKLAILIKTALKLRWRVVVFAFLVAGSYGTFILLKQNVRWPETVFFLSCLLLIISPEIQKSFLQQALLLKQEISIVQIADIVNQGTRLLIITIIFLIIGSYLTIQTVLLINVFSVWISFLFIAKKSRSMRNYTVDIDIEYRRVLLHYIKLNWHTTSFFAFQGQISIFLIGIFGSTNNLADLGALTKFSLIFTALSALVSNIVGPLFGRCQEKLKLIKIFVIVLISLSLITIFTLTIVNFFPEAFLWILGNQYKNLSYELLLVFLSGLVSFAAGSIFTLNASKGWIKYSPVWEIPVNIIVLIIGVCLFNVNTLVGVLKLGALSGVAILTLYLANTLAGFKHLN